MPALAAPIGALAAAVGKSRVVSDVHYPSDIAGGWPVGVGVAMLTLRWWPLRHLSPRPRQPPDTAIPSRCGGHPYSVGNRKLTVICSGLLMRW
jgi:membrane-associated phospholipid phosphatase